MPPKSNELLDPKNDFVFKRLFADSPELLAHLISDIRHQHPPVTEVQVLNPEIKPEEITGKFIVLDILAKDARGHMYNIEMQVCKYIYWPARGTYYLSRIFGQQLVSGGEYDTLKPVIGIHFLDFELFDDDRKSSWHFQLRDNDYPDLRLGDELHLHLVELPKAERKGRGGDALSHWITLLNHWKEDHLMGDISYEPVQQARSKIQALSADEEAQRMAFVRERAVRDEYWALRTAKLEGRTEGMIEGQRDTLVRLLQTRFGPLDEKAIARLKSASASDLDTWLQRIFEVTSVQELLGALNRE